ncbi:hypothetical protein GOP47_0003227 [Adiantum capillus-veneris]|uniref:Uncharacterized protein n=1 Tax=Adiantum capillus-veneris TaxID=13818 RepID=A0A9D4ZPW4_ADICA|nr:hypothetical protein GOP47_0003227 [Adiantum capillus-veneris]
MAAPETSRWGAWRMAQTMAPPEAGGCVCVLMQELAIGGVGFEKCHQRVLMRLLHGDCRKRHGLSVHYKFFSSRGSEEGVNDGCIIINIGI